MVRTTLKAVLLGVLLNSLSVVATPTGRLGKRLEEGVDCTSNIVDAPPGLFFVIAQDGTALPCDGLDDVKSTDANVNGCYVTNDKEGSLGDPVKCRGDPPPKKNPDGSDVQAPAETVMHVWCDIVKDEPLFVEFISIPACLIFGYVEGGSTPIAAAETGAFGLCDILFEGACTWFKDVAPELQAGMSRPCTEYPDSDACLWANPG